MAAPIVVTVFLSPEMLNRIDCISYVFGYVQNNSNNNSIIVNCTAAIETKENDKIFVEELISEFKHSIPDDSDYKLSFLGLLYCSTRQKRIEMDYLDKYVDNVRFVLRINKIRNSFHFENLYVERIPIHLTGQVITYDVHGLLKSKLLPFRKESSDYFGESFIPFLYYTCKSSAKSSYLLDIYKRDNVNLIYIYDDNQDTSFLTEYLLPCVMILRVFKMFTRLTTWLPELFTNIILLSSVGQQFHQRYHHLHYILKTLEERKDLSLKFKNLIFAIFFDVISGCIITYALYHSALPLIILDMAIMKTNDLVNGLQNLIHWLMGVPAGLKLNIPLNYALGHFFLYHIYLWESYMMVVQPVFVVVVKIMCLIGIFGLTYFLSLLCDLISLATIHIYCFYGYATRLYGYQMMSLSALWRLFRGKKWNPLRQRIDSYSYDVYQLYLGTLIFTVLLFLLPTVMVYYFVFTCLRIVVLIVQGLMSRIINILTVCPLYAVVLRIFCSSETTGDVFFSVFNAEANVALTMQASQVPFRTVIKMSLPDLKKYQDILTWKDLLFCICWGKIIYPL